MADDVEFESRMSDADALMWTIEKDPLLRSTITTVMVFDRPDRPRAALRLRLDRVSRVIPRLRQRVQGHPCSVAPPRWDVDPNFDLDYHLRFTRAAPWAERHPTTRPPARRARPGRADRHAGLRPGPARCGSSPWSTDLDDDRSRPDHQDPPLHHRRRGRGEAADGAARPRARVGETTCRCPRRRRPPRVSERGRMVDAVVYEGRRQLASAGPPDRLGRWHQAGRLTSDPLGHRHRAARPRPDRWCAWSARPAEPLSPLMTGRSLSVHFDTLHGAGRRR